MATTNGAARAEENGRGASGPPSSLHLESTQVIRERGASVRVLAELQMGGRTVRGESQGIGVDTVELRVAAEAALDALRKGSNGLVDLRIVGIKRLHVFDSDIVVVALTGPGGSPTCWVGSTPSPDDPARGAVRAVLNAVCPENGGNGGHLRPTMQVDAAAISRSLRPLP